MKKLIVFIALAFIVSGCQTDAMVASHNLSKDAEMFKINRRVVFVNGITDKYMLSIEGRCSIEDRNKQLEVTCRTGETSYMKHFLGLSDNVTYFVEQLEPRDVSVFHYKVIFKPQIIIPDIDLIIE
jgi:hypothetical protein